MTMIATIITKIADATGTTRFKLARMTCTGESGLNPPFPLSGISRTGAIVPETPLISIIKTLEFVIFFGHCFRYVPGTITSLFKVNYFYLNLHLLTGINCVYPSKL